MSSTLSDNPVHSLLRRQLKRCLGDDFHVPEEWAALINAVDEAYRAFDADRRMLERSLELSSQELLHASAEMREVFQAIPDLLIRLDRHGTVLDCKVGAGSDGSAAQARDAAVPPVELALAHLTPEFRVAATRVLASRNLETMEYALETRGETRRYEARLAPVLQDQVVAFIRDVTARKRAEEELFNSREMLRTVLDTIPQRVFWKDRDSTYLGCNRAMADDSGLDQAAIAGKRLEEVETPEHAALYRADDLEVMNADRPKLSYEEPRILPDGSRRWLRTSKVPLHDKKGNVIGVLGTYEDVTERKQADALRAGQNRILEMIVNGAPLDETLRTLAELVEAQVDGSLCSVSLADREGGTLHLVAAPSLSREFVERLRDLPVGEGMAGSGTAAHRRAVAVATDIREDPLWTAWRERAEAEGVRACWAAPVMSHQDAVLGAFAMYFRHPRSPSPEHLQLIQLATRLAGIAIQRRQAEQELQRTVSLVRSTFDSTADGIVVVDLQGGISTFNKRFVSIWQIPPEVIEKHDREAVLQHALSLVKDPPGFVRRVLEVEADPEGNSFDTIEFKDGRVFERYSCPQYVNGAPIGRVWSFRDVSERIRLEEQFRQAQKMEAIGQLAGGVAHDFNNLLTVILGNLSVMRAYDLTPDQQRTAIEDCFRSAQRAANLTGQLLTFSRRQPIEPRELDLNEVVANLTKMLQRLIGEHITLETRYAPGGAPVRADPGMMEQALMNLALNSRDAMPKGGRLTISTAVVKLDAQMLRLRTQGRPGAFVQLCVTDSGQGIAPEHLPHIFEPFFTTKEVGKGTGLGLATVFGIVEQHEGWVEVESQPGVGTTMRVFLPQLLNANPRRSESHPVTLPRLGHETILVAEDEAEVRALMSKVLQRHGYRVYAASNAAEAVMLWQEHHAEIDLLITDMVMPGGVGGRELADRLLIDKPDLRIVYCSGYTDEMLGPDLPLRRSPNFLEKPFDVHRFLERVRSCLDSAP